ncbi:MAG: hypothetical protein D6690_08780 [Nitrospirae bacterium]|nr:MAG: hypothetical protein D6690_08780 [Nitrospirota bacterium]
MRAQWNGKVLNQGVAALVGIALALGSASMVEASSTGEEIFDGFTRHISRQIEKDKFDFVAAQDCTVWFYRQMREMAKPPRVEKIAFHRMIEASEDRDCPQQYPEGLESARKDFGRTQQSLSLSLTFFQFALVGDRDDDRRYSLVELRDLLESIGLVFEDRLPSSRYILALTDKFDTLYEARALSILMKSMDVLYSKGYRFTNADQQVLNRELH